MLRQPLLHFLLLGGLLFSAERYALPEVGEPIAVDEAQVQQLREDWRRETGAWPDAAELQASLQKQVDDERLLREALRLQLDQSDRVSRWRLLSGLRFALGEDAGDDETLLKEARRLDLAARDIVTRRRLVQLMQQRLLQDQAPPDTELRAYVAEHAPRYALPARYSFEQRYFGKRDAAEQALRTHAAKPTGEAFLLGNRFDSLSQEEIASKFGHTLAQAVAKAPPGAWLGPVASPYGSHLIRISAVQAPQAPDFAAVRTRAAYAWLAEHEVQRLQQALVPLRARYPAQLAPALLAQGLRA